MSSSRQYLVHAIRNAPDEVILDLVVSGLDGMLGAPPAKGPESPTSKKRSRRQTGKARSSPAPSGRAEAVSLVFDGRHATARHPDGSACELSGTSVLLLHHLSRARRSDEAEGLSDAGWRQRSHVLDALGINVDHLHVLAYRARKALAAAGFQDMIERHRPTRSLRLALASSQLEGL